MQLHLHPSLRRYADGALQLELTDIKSSDQILTTLQQQHPVLSKKIITENQKLNGYVNLYINGKDYRYLEKQALSSGDRLELVTALVGG